MATPARARGGGRPPPLDVPEPTVAPVTRVFQSVTISAVRTLVSRCAAEAGMDASRTSDLVLAVSEIAGNSVLHAEGWGTLRVWRDGGAVVCEVSDKGKPDRPLAARRPEDPAAPNGYGLWLAHQLCDRVETHCSPAGTVVRCTCDMVAAATSRGRAARAGPSSPK